MSPVGEMTNADVLLVLLPEETAAAAKLENRVLADAVANEKTTEDKKRIGEIKDTETKFSRNEDLARNQSI